jgi:hypothetical protein
VILHQILPLKYLGSFNWLLYMLYFLSSPEFTGAIGTPFLSIGDSLCKSTTSTSMTSSTTEYDCAHGGLSQVVFFSLFHKSICARLLRMRQFRCNIALLRYQPLQCTHVSLYPFRYHTERLRALDVELFIS